ncbi:MAG TPA: right-handed parallel beta-helix repeat-containing protein [Xanthobacteraceae bacterium]
MKRFPKLASIVALFVIGWIATPANAQGYKTWIASTGSDANNCSRSAPCATLTGAYAKTSAGGEIICADSVAFSYISIEKSLTINCEGTAGVNTAANNTQTVGSMTISTNSGDTIVLRGIDIDGQNRSNGIEFLGAGTLIIEHSRIANGYNGIIFRPNASSKLVVANNLITTSGSGTTGAGILVAPSYNASAQIMIDHAVIASNVFGIAIDGSQSTAGINATISDSVLASNKNDGVVATTSPGHAPIGLMVKNTKSTNNGYGIRSIGPNVTVRVDGSTIIGNGTGVSALSGGSLLTLHTNVVHANGTDGSFTGSLSLQ